MRHCLYLILVVLFVAPQAHAQQKGKPIPVLFISDEVIMNEDLPEHEQFFTLFKNKYIRYTPPKFAPQFIPIQQKGLTASGVLQVMPDILKHRPHVAVVALGFAEARQGVDTDLIYNGLEQLVETLKRNYMYVILLGTRAPEEADLGYASRFNNMYAEIAQRQQVAFYPDIYANLRRERDTFIPGTYTPTKYGVNYAMSAMAPWLDNVTSAITRRYQP